MYAQMHQQPAMVASMHAGAAGQGEPFRTDYSETTFPLSVLPRSQSMDVQNDPRFFSENVISKRLAAFKTICVVAVLMVNLSVKQMFTLEKDISLHTVGGVINYTGFCLMTLVFLMNLATVIVLIQQLFMTYRLLTCGPTGFEIAKSYYLNPNIVTMRHVVVKGFFCSLPLFVASSSCMVYASFDKNDAKELAYPIVGFLALSSLALWYINVKHQSIFRERYALCKSHEEPLIMHVEQMSQRSRGWWPSLDV
mmetsp:Transcript_55823/g.180960  ORF Transcript_55823/g.180960 Transcript_55823/m.180960 type:complete len:252 (+) Transcript_55823:121-876(+)